MRALLSVAALLALGAQDQTPTFRTTTRLVELTVTALDKKGLPVTDLRLEDFAIQDNGKSRPVSFLEYDGAIPTQSWETAQREGLRYARRLKPARDAVSLRVIVRDMVTGRYGTLDVPLKTLPVR